MQFPRGSCAVKTAQQQSAGKPARSKAAYSHPVICASRRL
jgi:hypothetical protein